MRNRVVSIKAVLVVIVAMVVQLLFVVAPAANAQTPLSDNNFSSIATLPNGRAFADMCSSASSSVAFDSFGSDGVLITPAAEPISGYSFYGECSAGNVAADGTIVTLAYKFDGPYKIVAHKNNEIVWSKDVTDLCDQDATPFSPSISGDNKVYYGIDSNCPSSHEPELAILDLATGITLAHETLADISYVNEYYFRPYLNGYVYVADGFGELVYLGLDGKKDTTRSYALTHPMQYGRWAIDADGNPIVLSDVNGQPVLVFRDANGIETVSELADCESCSVQNIYASPLGGAVLELVDNSAGKRYIEFVSPDANTPAQLIDTDGSTYESGQIVSVDVYGNTLYAMGYDIPGAGYYEKDQVRFVLYDSAGSIVSQGDTESVGTANDAFDLLDVHSVATSNGYVHAILRRAGQYEMHRFDFAKVGIDYPRGVLLGDTSTAPEPLNYVAMGDSFSSGEGVEPFINGTDTSSNSCHRSKKAYAMLLMQDLDSRLNMSQDTNQFVACSGAKSDNVQSVGQFNEAEQSSHLNEGTDLVTITIGGNDVGFGDTIVACADPGAEPQSISREQRCANARTEMWDKLDEDVVSNAVGLALLKIDLSTSSSGGGQVKTIVGGYPNPFPTSHGVECSWGPWWSNDPAFPPGVIPQITSQERDDFQAITTEINVQIEWAVSGFPNMSFVPVQSVFAGHDACSTEPWINNIEIDEARRAYSYHPNQLGQHEYYQLFKAKLLVD